MSLGGVGRNIAHNMALLGVDVRMVTVFGDDINAQKIAASCGELGIDISQSPVIPDGRTSTYLFITDEKGDMALAVSDMEIYKHLTPQMLAQRQTLLNASQAVVLDTNLPAESIQYLADHCTAPLFADPVSTAKAVKLKPVLGKLHTLKPNRIEAELLSGVKITDDASLRKAAETLLDTGLHRVFIFSGFRRRLCRRPVRAAGAASPSAGSYGEHHRLRRRFHGSDHMGLFAGYGPD